MSDYRLQDKEAPEDRHARESLYWAGVKERRLDTAQAIRPTISPEAIQVYPGYYWWRGYQAGAQ